tara:strand:- start:999 stop:2492 length:1494 start_codon:yes stop_codon:yes gene_type:complete
MKKNLIFKNDIFIIFLIIVFIFFIRSPFFFIDYLDSDEATFILKGLAILKGKIPYIDFQNYKPPISGYFLTFPIYFADNSLFAVRFFTAGIVSLSCIFLYKIGILYHFSKLNSLITSMIFGTSISFIARSEKSQSFYSEHISIMLILICLYLLIKCFENKKISFFFIQGCCLGIASLNTPYIGFFSLLYITFPFFFLTETKNKKIIFSLSIIFGGLSVLLIFLFYFYPKVPGLISYIFSAALSEIFYTYSQTIYHLIGAGLHVGSFKFFSAVFIWGLGFFGLLHIVFTKNFEKKYIILLTSLIILSVSIILIRYPSGRYLIIILPFYCLLLTYFINLKLFNNFKILKKFILILIFLFPFIDWYKNIIILNDAVLNKKTFTYGRCTDLYNALEKNSLLNKKIYYQDCHINLFFINQLPITDIYHPDDIFYEDRMRAYDKKYLGDELFAKKPEIIVIKLNLFEFLNNLKFKKIKPNQILKRYEFVFKKSNLYVYQLKYH